MAEKHKSKYKTPKDLEKSQKLTSRKDIKDYTVDDKNGKLNPKSTGEKQSNVLRKTDKKMQDDGKYDVKYNADDRLYKDLEDGEYDVKHAAKILKKRQDNEEKEISDVIADKVENLTREQKERLVREYVRRKIVKVLLEQPDLEKKQSPEDTTTEPEQPIDAPAPEAPAPPAPTPEAPIEPAATEVPAATPPSTSAPAAEPETPEGDAESQISPETKEALDIERFVQYLKKQEGNISKLKSIIKVINLSLSKAEIEDKANIWKMLKITANKKLGNLGS
jgi:hypothetical protein